MFELFCSFFIHPMIELTSSSSSFINCGLEFIGRRALFSLRNSDILLTFGFDVLFLFGTSIRSWSDPNSKLVLRGLFFIFFILAGQWLWRMEVWKLVYPRWRWIFVVTKVTILHSQTSLKRVGGRTSRRNKKMGVADSTKRQWKWSTSKALWRLTREKADALLKNNLY